MGICLLKNLLFCFHHSSEFVQDLLPTLVDTLLGNTDPLCVFPFCKALKIQSLYQLHVLCRKHSKVLVKFFSQDAVNGGILNTVRGHVGNHFFTKQFIRVKVTIQNLSISSIFFIQSTSVALNAVICTIHFSADLYQDSIYPNPVFPFFCHMAKPP